MGRIANMIVADKDLELYFNELANKYPRKYYIHDIDTTDWTEDMKQRMQTYIDKWNEQLKWMDSSLKKANIEASRLGDLPDPEYYNDIGVSPIVSDPYNVTYALRKKEYHEFVAEKYRRSAEHYDVMAIYYGEGNV